MKRPLDAETKDTHELGEIEVRLGGSVVRIPQGEVLQPVEAVRGRLHSSRKVRSVRRPQERLTLPSVVRLVSSPFLGLYPVAV